MSTKLKQLTIIANLFIFNIFLFCHTDLLKAKENHLSRLLENGIVVDLKVSPTGNIMAFKLKYEKDTDILFYDFKNKKVLDFGINSLLILEKDYQTSDLDFDKKDNVFFSINHVFYSDKLPESNYTFSKPIIPKYVAPGSIYQLQISKRSIEKILDNPSTDKKGILNVMLSPDNNSLFYLASTWPKYDLYYYSIDSGKNKLLDTTIYYPSGAYKTPPLWLPNSQNILYVKHNCLCLVDIKGTKKIIAKFNREKENILRFYYLPNKLVCITGNLEEAALKMGAHYTNKSKDLTYSFWLVNLENGEKKLTSQLTSPPDTKFEELSGNNILISIIKESDPPREVIHTEIYSYDYTTGDKFQIPSLKCNLFKNNIQYIGSSKKLIYSATPYIDGKWGSSSIILHNLEKETTEKLIGGKNWDNCLTKQDKTINQ